jgi:hypothetical protein
MDGRKKKQPWKSQENREHININAFKIKIKQDESNFYLMLPIIRNNIVLFESFWLSAGCPNASSIKKK